MSSMTTWNRAASRESSREHRVRDHRTPTSPDVYVPVHRSGRPAWLATLITRLGPNEFRRRLWHFMPGFLAILGAFIPRREPIAAWILMLLAAFCLGLIGIALKHCSTFRRPDELNCRMSIFGYAAGIVPLLILFPSQPELAMTVTGVIAFGDGGATLFGLLFGKTKLPWNPRKTWVGLAAFVIISSPIALFIYWVGALPSVTIAVALGCVGPTVLGAAIVESLPRRLNDNIFVSVSAATIVIAMHGYLVGWI